MSWERSSARRFSLPNSSSCDVDGVLRIQKRTFIFSPQIFLRLVEVVASNVLVAVVRLEGRRTSHFIINKHSTVTRTEPRLPRTVLERQFRIEITRENTAP